MKTPVLTILEALRLEPMLPRLDREVLLSHILCLDRVFLMTHDETELTPIQTRRYRASLARALRHEPIAYITGVREFYGRNFSVGGGVLIPRPETELLVEHALKNILSITQTKKNIAIIDVGTGSGAIITSIFLSLELATRKNISWFAVDTELAALRYARKNAKRHGVAKSIRFMKSDLLSRLLKPLSSYDEVFVVANLPYLSTTLYQSTAANVQEYEPKSALVSGADGLTHYKRLMEQLLILKQHGTNIHFFLEISPEQGILVPDLFQETAGEIKYQIVPDLTSRPRLVMGVLRGVT